MIYPNGQRILMAGGTHIAGSLVTTSALGYGGVRGARLNRFVSDTYNRTIGGIPSGYGVKSVLMPIVSGAISGRNVVKISGAATGTQGLPATGALTFTIATNTPAGELISSGTGSATFSLTTTGNVLASLSGIGSASMAFATNTPQMAALGWAAASGAFSMTCSLTSYARGFMSGSTVDSTTLTSAAIASAVWEYVNRTLTSGGGGGGGLTLAEIESSIVLAKEATVASRASQASVDAIGQAPSAASIADAVWAKELP